MSNFVLVFLLKHGKQEICIPPGNRIPIFSLPIKPLTPLKVGRKLGMVKTFIKLTRFDFFEDGLLDISDAGRCLPDS